MLGVYIIVLFFFMSQPLNFKTLFSTDSIVFFDSFFGGGAGPVFLDNLGCTGEESRLSDCPNDGVNVVTNCRDHSDDAGVRCCKCNGYSQTKHIWSVHWAGPEWGMCILAWNFTFFGLCSFVFYLPDWFWILQFYCACKKKKKLQLKVIKKTVIFSAKQ